MKSTRIVTTLLAITAMLMLAVAPVGAAPNKAGFGYVVQLGDTLSSISHKFGVSPDVILDVNHLRNRPDLIFVGETLTLPISMGFTPSLVSPFFYVIQAGDTVQTLNNKFYIDRFTVRQVNNIPADSNVLTPGATILIPAGPHRYTVHSGDTIQSIAAMFGQSVNTLLRFNSQLGNGLALAPGMFVYVPIVYNVGFTPVSGAPVGVVIGNDSGGGGFVPNPNGGTGLHVNDSSAAAQAANANVITSFQTIIMPQNVVNLDSALTVRWVQLRRVRRDPSRDNGAIATVAVQFRGGTGSVSVQHYVTVNGSTALRGLPVTGIYVNAGEAELWNDIEVDVPATCSANLQDQLTITSGITQQVHVGFWINCP